MPNTLNKVPTAPRGQGRSPLVSVVLAGCLLLFAVGYQSARRQTEEARAIAAEEHQQYVFYQDALSKFQSGRNEADGTKRADQAYILWLEKRLARYDAGTPASWRASAEVQARDAARAASEAQLQEMLVRMKVHMGLEIQRMQTAREQPGE